MNRPKIIFINPGPTYNASSPIFQEKYKFFSKFYSGYILTVSSSSERIQIKDFSYHSVAATKRFTDIKFIIFCLIWGLKIKNTTSIDCIITYDPLKTGFIGCILKKILKAKLVVEVNGVYTSPLVWSEGSDGVFLQVIRLIVQFIMRYVLSVADGIKLLFPSQLDGFKNLNLKSKIVVFPDWVPVNYFKNLGEEKEILFVGFPFYIKGVDILIKSFKQIASKFPDWKLKILGWFPDKALLEKEIGGHPQISHHPPVHYSKMPEHIGRCGILVLPSRTEAMGRVLLEAAAAEKPRIGTKVDGIPTVIHDGVDGFLVESENVHELAEKMSMLMADAKLRKKIGSAAADRAKTEFSEEKYLENYIQFIQEILAKIRSK
jgi:glycosyltransferase involved in cell wall biosynthesis